MHWYRNRPFGLIVFALLAACLLHAAADAQESEKKSNLMSVKRTAILRGFPDWVTSVAFSPDGKQIAAGSYEVVKIFDAKTKKQQSSLNIKSGYVRSLAFSPDGKTLAVGSYQSVELRDTEKFETRFTLEGHFSDVTGASFSPDGKLLATSSDDTSVRIWNVADGKEVRAITEIEAPVQSVAFSPQGEWIAAAVGDPLRPTKRGYVKMYNVATGKERTWTSVNGKNEQVTIGLVEHLKAATDVTFSPDGRHLASASEDKKVHIYDVESGKALGYFDGHVRPTSSVLFLPDGKTIASCSRIERKAEIKFWNRDDGDEIALIEKMQDRVTDMSLSPDGTKLATAGYDKTVMLWDLTPVLKKVSPDLLTNTVPVVAKKDEKVAGNKTKTFRVGIIGLDTSHVLAFTKALNDPKAAADIANCRVVAAYPKGSPDIESSTSRVPGYIEKIKGMDVEIVDSISALIEKVDVVLLETNDGRPHLEQILPVLKAGKPVFIDKPIAGTLADAIAIFEAARKYNVPIFSSSSLRYGAESQAVRNGSIGDVISATTHSPCSLEKTHPDLFWYGIHGVESLFTVMGTGCQSVIRSASTADMDEVVGLWKGKRIGTFQGYRNKVGKGGYGGIAIGSKGVNTQIGKYAGYRPLVVDYVKFFRTGKVPVSEAETLEIYAFMEAADESKRLKGKEVTLESVMKKARAEAKKRLAELDK